MLGSAVGAVVRRSEKPCDRADGDDVAGDLLFLHAAGGLAGAEKDACEICLDDGLPVFGCDVDQLAFQAPPGVVDEDVNPAKSGFGLVEKVDDIRNYLG